MNHTEPSHVRVHYGLSGSVPLQLFEFVFEPGGCYVFDCGAFTPLFGLARGKHTERAAALDAVYDSHGVDGLLGVADSVTWVSAEEIERITLYTGGWLGRPKLSVQTTGEPSVRPVRIHGVDVERVSDGLETLLEGRVPVERIDGIGLRG